MADIVTLQTGTGFWNPIAWIIAFIIAIILSYIIWSFGEKDYKKETIQTSPFLSGNPEPQKGEMHVRAGNLYWGYLEALQGYYSRLIPLHSGIINDYVIWFLGVMAIVLVIVGVIQ
jgi:ABC-type multidrug transport system permease subunit